MVMRMVEFIICDDDRKFLKQVEDLISKIMLKKNLGYNIVKFYDYDDKFFNHMSTKDSARIFILDIETPTNSGVIVGRKIRKNDYDSPIIFLTGHEELGNMLLRKDLMFLAFTLLHFYNYLISNLSSVRYQTKYISAYSLFLQLYLYLLCMIYEFE